VLDVPEHLLTAGQETDSDPALPEPLWTPVQEPAGAETVPTTV